MKITHLASFALASSLLLVGASSTALAQQAAAPQEKAEDKADDKAKAQTVSGELMSVDAEKKTLAVKLADGAEWTFNYTATTEISGDKKGEQGLATSAGSKVVVHYTSADDKKTATKIEIQPAMK
jgi:hypothetical protein